jgi:multidrug efflux pump subunit AcrA (membrane-fusion protein)
MVLENRPLTTDLAIKQAIVARYKVEAEAVSADSPVEYQMKVQQLADAKASLKVLQEQVDKLTIRAPFDGQMIAPDIRSMVGEYLSPSRREILRVEDESQQYVEAALPQDDYQLLQSEENKMKAEVRMVGTVSRTSPALGIQLVHPASNEMISPALTPLGGGTSAIDQSDRNQRKLAAPEFRARITVDDAGNYVPGQRAYVRFKLAKKSLLWQWGRRAWQLIESRGASAKWL